MEQKFLIPEYVITALSKLKNGGEQAYLVGGCVRDFLLCKTPDDFDIATSAVPEKTLRLFTEYKCVTDGIKHGTVTPVIAHKPLEITTFRTESEYSDKRHPDKVKFSLNLEDDLSRRDFTVNAMAMDADGKIYDFYGGLNDLKNKLIRCVGKPDKRFGEDALRILRALRFASVLGFKIEPETEKSISKNIKSIKNVSAQRIYNEYKKLISGKDAGKVICRFPFLCTELFGIKLSERKKRALRAINSPSLITAAIFLGEDVGKFNYLLPDNAAKKRLKKLTEAYRINIKNKNLNEKDIRLILFKNGLETGELVDVLRLRKAFGSALKCDRFTAVCKKIEAEGLCYKPEMLDINGGDLMSVGIKNKGIREVKEKLTLAVINGECVNKKESLISAARTMCKA